MNIERFNNPWLWLKLLFPVAAIVFMICGWLNPDYVRIFGLPVRYSDFGFILFGCMYLVFAADKSITKGRLFYRIFFACLGVLFLSLYGFSTGQSMKRVLLQEQTAKLQDEFNRSVTPLMLAAGKGDINEMKKLLEQGADVQARNQIDLSALDYACGAMQSPAGKVRGSPEAVKLLLDHGADVNDSGKYGRTALMHAVRSRNLPLIEVLIKRGADVNRISNDGHSALFYAQLDRSREVVELLKKSGANTIGPGEGQFDRK